MKGLVAFCCSMIVLVYSARADDVSVAVAANFLPIAEQIAGDFERATGHRVTVTHGSTGQLYALIVNGAPVDVFLAADRDRPFRLLEDGAATEIRTYALGRLFLVSRAKIDVDVPQTLFEGKNVALADPLLAPYGAAAMSAMESLSLDTATFQPLPVGNVAQAATLFATGNADLAFVAASLLPLLNAPFSQAMEGRHPPIRQDAALLNRAAGNDAAQAFWAYLFSGEARPRIRGGGYALP